MERNKEHPLSKEEIEMIKGATNVSKGIEAVCAKRNQEREEAFNKPKPKGRPKGSGRREGKH